MVRHAETEKSQTENGASSFRPRVDVVKDSKKFFAREGTVRIPSSTTKLVASEFIAHTLEKEPSVVVAEFGSNFRKWFSDKTEDPYQGRVLCFKTLNAPSKDTKVMSLCGGKEKVAVTFTEFVYLLTQQGRGGQGVLLTDSIPSLFYIPDSSSKLRVVIARFRPCGWGVGACRLNESDCFWPRGTRIFAPCEV